jgi:hypothetical protein
MIHPPISIDRLFQAIDGVFKFDFFPGVPLQLPEKPESKCSAGQDLSDPAADARPGEQG